MMSTGSYINVTTKNKNGHTMDVFVILNEPNDAPTSEENSKIAGIVQAEIEKYAYPETTIDEFKHDLETELMDAPVGCTTWGVQILVSM